MKKSKQIKLLENIFDYLENENQELKIFIEKQNIYIQKLLLKLNKKENNEEENELSLRLMILNTLKRKEFQSSREIINNLIEKYPNLLQIYSTNNIYATISNLVKYDKVLCSSIITYPDGKRIRLYKIK